MGEGDCEALTHFVESRGSGHQQAASVIEAQVGRRRTRLAHPADDFLEQVLQRHDTARASVLVHHERHLSPFPSHDCKDGIEARGSRHGRHDLRMTGTNGLVPEGEAQQTLDVDDAEHPIQVLLVQGVSRVRECPQRPLDGLRVTARRNAGHSDSGRHHFARREIPELEDLVHQAAEFDGQGSGLLALPHDELQLLGRVVLLVRGGLAIDADQ